MTYSATLLTAKQASPPYPFTQVAKAPSTSAYPSYPIQSYECLLLDDKTRPNEQRRGDSKTESDVKFLTSIEFVQTSFVYDVSHIARTALWFR